MNVYELINMFCLFISVATHQGLLDTVNIVTYITYCRSVTCYVN